MRDAVAASWSLEPLATRIERAGHIAGSALPVVSDDAMRQRLAGTAAYTLILLRATDKLARPAANAIIWEHGRRNMALAEAGLLSIVLPVTDDSDLSGIGVFAGPSGDVRAIMDDDPGVRAGIFTYEVHPVRGFPGAALP